MKTILLVDDDQELRTLFGRVLRQGGYYVIEADPGVKGLEELIGPSRSAGAGRDALPREPP